MASLSTTEKQILESLFQMESGYVLNFSDRTMGEFFQDDIGVNIYSDEFNYASGSKANRMRGFWYKANNKLVGKSIYKLVEYIETQLIIGRLDHEDFPKDRIVAGLKIAKKLYGEKFENKEDRAQASLVNGSINIALQKDVFSHVQKLLEGKHYYNAVEEAYKIVREKLKSVSGKERATDAFKKENYKKIFGHEPKDQVEQDFFEGVKFLHMAIQFLRNEKAHKPATVLEKNLAIHYISLASLAYDLINRSKDE